MPRKIGPASAALARLLLRLLGWQTEGDPPAIPKFVCVVAPHTSNWDFVYCMLGSIALRVPGDWVGKHTLFRGPLGAFLRSLGGIPVDRAQPQGLVAQIVRAFATRDHMVFVITPEGTRAWTPHWRAGFYEIAHAANVPIVLCYADYRRKRCGFGPHVHPTGDRAHDMAQIADFYATITPKHPKHAGPIALRPQE